MPQQSETRQFAGGIDTDSAPHLIPDGDVLAAVNTRALIQKGQGGGRREWIKGNSTVPVINAILPVGHSPYDPSDLQDTQLLGHCVDDATGKLYLLFSNKYDRDCIIEYDSIHNTARRALDDSMLTADLNFDPTKCIACNVVDGLLFWCQGNTDQRYINLSTVYSPVVPIPLSQLSVVQAPGFAPPTQTRTDTASASSSIQYTPLQFSYRVINTDGITGVLSPYSSTALPARVSAVQALAYSGNTVTVTIPVSQKIPKNWRQVEVIARFLDSNVYYVIRRWYNNVPADITDVANHNASIVPLTVANWAGVTLDVIDKLTASKVSDSSPINPQAQELAANRNILANFIEGYDTHTVVPSTTVTLDTFTPTAPTTLGNYAPYMVAVLERDTRNWYFAIILRFGPSGSEKNYLLPKECSIGRFFFDNNFLIDNTSPTPVNTTWNATVDIKVPAQGLFNIPTDISSHDLIEMKETGDPDLTTIGWTANPTTSLIRKSIVEEANGISIIPDQNGGTLNYYLLTWNGFGGLPALVTVEDVVSEFGPAGESRAFPPSQKRNIGLQYYDSQGRKSGVQNLTNVSIPSYDVAAPAFVNKVNVQLSGTTTAIPSWAAYYSFTIDRPANAQRMSMFFGGIVKAMFKTGDGEIVYRDPSELLSPSSGLTIYGIGIPIPKTSPYEYQAGDFIYFSPSGGNNRAEVLGTHAGHIVIQFTNDGVMHTLCAGWSNKMYQTKKSHGTGVAIDFDSYLQSSSRYQTKTAFILFSGISESTEMYELPFFGAIVSGQYGPLYSGGILTAHILGDAHTQIRTSTAGGGTGLAMSTRDATSATLVWVNDLGRPAPRDTVGQKRLANAVRYSNARIPGATVNGYGSFDAEDIKTVDIAAGDITALKLTTRGTQEGGQMIVLCNHGSFAALIGQQQIAGADGQTAFTAAAGVIGDFNALRGQWGCQSPRSVVDFEGKVWWVDAYKRAVIEFNESGAGNIGLFKTARLWDALLGSVTDPMQINCGVDSFTGNLLVTLPATSVMPADLPGWVGETNDADASNGSVRTWMYDWLANRWIGAYNSGAMIMRCGTFVFGWKNGLVWKEFSAAPGTYYGQAQTAFVVAPFNKHYPTFSTPRTFKITAGQAPFKTRVSSSLGSAGVAPYDPLDGSFEAAVMNNRVGNGATTTPQFNENGMNGLTLRGDTIMVAMYFNDGSKDIALSGATLLTGPDQGH